MFTYKCQCGKLYELDDAARGRRVKCAKCGQEAQAAPQPAHRFACSLVARCRACCKAAGIGLYRGGAWVVAHRHALFYGVCITMLLALLTLSWSSRSDLARLKSKQAETLAYCGRLARWLDGRFAGVQAELWGLQAAEDKLDDVDIKLPHVDSRLDDLDSKLQHVDSRLDDLDSKLDDLDLKLDVLDSKLDVLDSSLDPLDRKLDDLDSNLDNLHGKVDDIKRRLR